MTPSVFLSVPTHSDKLVSCSQHHSKLWCWDQYRKVLKVSTPRGRVPVVIVTVVHGYRSKITTSTDKIHHMLLKTQPKITYNNLLTTRPKQTHTHTQASSWVKKKSTNMEHRQMNNYRQVWSLAAIRSELNMNGYFYHFLTVPLQFW